MVQEPLGRVQFYVNLTDPRNDLDTVRIGSERVAGGFAWHLPKRVFVEVRTALLGTIELEIVTARKRLRVAGLSITPPRGQEITPAIMRRVADELHGMTRHAITFYLRTHYDERNPLDKRDATVWEQEVWALVIEAMYPRDEDGAAEYQLRLWEDIYKPGNRSQADLAADLGLTPGSLRVNLTRARKERKANQ